MPTQLRTVQLSDISLRDLSFVATVGREFAALQSSIASCGLLQPPWLWRSRQGEPWVIVCGYLRLHANRPVEFLFKIPLFIPALVAAFSVYGFPFTCAVAKDNIFAVQFHPEKSAQSGLALLGNFMRWQP